MSSRTWEYLHPISEAACDTGPDPAPSRALGWTDDLDDAWRESGLATRPGRVSRLDRGWSTVLLAPGGPVARVRNIGAEVAVGDWVVPSADGERVELVLPRSSAFVRRASFEGSRATSHTIAANIDVVAVLHSLTNVPNERRLERELVLAFDSGARPVVVLTKPDLVDSAIVTASRSTVQGVSPDVQVVVASGATGEGVGDVRSLASGATLALLGASGVGKSTLVNALVGAEVQPTNDVRDGDQRGRHTTTASQLVELAAWPGLERGWLIDTPGVRAVSLWSSGRGIERAFADVFELMDRCRFRDCKHDDEPGCAVRDAVEAGALDPLRLASMKRLVAEEAKLEDEQRAQLKAQDRRGSRRRPTPS